VSGGAFLKSYIEERAIQIGLFVVENGATVRQTARKFGISKSTVHKDITTRLIHVQPELARQAQAVLQINKAERHIRGGLATKEKYSRTVY
jgi:putative DeoR family transcriptional regulator (stage III sporulation protein D)